MTTISAHIIISVFIAFVSTSIINADSNKNSQPTSLRVTTQTLSELLFTTNYSAPASVVSSNHSDISAEIQARALRINAKIGDQIKKGALLVELDCRSYINNKKQAEASLRLTEVQRNLAEKQLTRNRRLLQRGVLPREDYDQAESSLQSSNADIELKKTNIKSADIAISKCKIYAPFNGQITQKKVQQGQIVSPGTPLIRLLQTDTLEVEAALSASELLAAKDSPKLHFTQDNIHHKVSIRTVIQQINSVTNTQRVRLSVENNDQIIAGLNGRLEWQDNARKIPPEYMVRRGDLLGIMLANEGVATFHPIKNAKEGQPASVNLLSTSQVIIVNRYSAQNGQAVAID